jgi:hypothetical protein
MIRQVQQGERGNHMVDAAETQQHERMSDTLNRRCDECGSLYRGESSQMAGLCSECAHQLYGYPPCAHRMVAGRCEICGWDGSVSPYLAGLKGSTPG